jgi:hypothetical protein
MQVDVGEQVPAVVQQPLAGDLHGPAGHFPQTGQARAMG